MTEIDCRELLRQLWMYLDGEADAPVGQDLQRHIARCLPCRQHAEFERRLREIIQYKCRGERAPDPLRQELARLLRISIQRG
ncbi:MAG: mycothiol system anti-sigma-R factor [Armatimonadota bacterium]|nr:mycothiol system anti-sigma-R factor [Armatimonadota bacterium]MDR7532486.1 mycothiol system anti-sigma-R factor [Armatimonadota bacterium]MDR7535623.1 mycothiol system anti-sigma-R factor [Armatimonadota bacterium]